MVPCRYPRAPRRRNTCARIPLRRIEERMIRGTARFVFSFALILPIVFALGPSAHAAPDAAFTAFLQSVWPEAQNLGVSRATFDAATRGLAPDLSLPHLVI